MISMKKVNYAAIDIGSNAVRLLIKCVNEENAPELMSKVQLIRIPLRLGEDAFTMGVISAEKEKKLIRLMKAYKQLMKIYDVVDYRACATSAMRDARNGKDITRQIARKTGIRVDIIDGQEEAHIVYDNHIEQLFASGQNYLYVDVGGGSTEINLISNGELKFPFIQYRNGSYAQRHGERRRKRGFTHRPHRACCGIRAYQHHRFGRKHQ